MSGAPPAQLRLVAVRGVHVGFDHTEAFQNRVIGTVLKFDMGFGDERREQRIVTQDENYWSRTHGEAFSDPLINTSILAVQAAGQNQ